MAAALAFTILISAGPAAAGNPPHGPYFGQSPPGLVPSVFAPGIVSLPDRYEYVIAFSPDGRECLFGVTNSDWSTCDLFYSKQIDGAWSKPARAPFQGDGDGWLPSFAPDGKRLYFSSGRPTLALGADAYTCERTPEGWGPPKKMGPPINSPKMDWRTTEISTGTLYFTSDRDGEEGKMDIFRSVPVNGEYRTIEKLGPPVGSPYLDASPCVSLDEKVLIFESWRPGGHGQGDLYISYRKDDGSWTEPQNLGAPFNTAQIEDGGSFSPDGKYFFFNRREGWVTKKPTDIWWVDARAVYKPYVANPAGEARAVVGKTFTFQLPAGEFADYDDATLVYAASAPGGSPLPKWLAFDPKTRTLRGKPDRAGKIAVEITATDAAGSACRDTLIVSAAR